MKYYAINYSGTLLSSNTVYGGTRSTETFLTTNENFPLWLTRSKQIAEEVAKGFGNGSNVMAPTNEFKGCYVEEVQVTIASLPTGVPKPKKSEEGDNVLT